MKLLAAFLAGFLLGLLCGVALARWGERHYYLRWQGGLRRLPLGKTRLRATDTSQGREVTPERGPKNRAPARAHPLPSPLYSEVQPWDYPAAYDAARWAREHPAG